MRKISHALTARKPFVLFFVAAAAVIGALALGWGAASTEETVTLDQLRDQDGDECSDAEELGTNGALGGLRDPLNFWDFYDVWTHPGGNPNLWVRDKSIDLFNDMFEVNFRFGLTGNALADPLVPPPPGTTAYHPSFDRGAVIEPNVWNVAPADGTIDPFNDIFGVSFQFGHNCQGPLVVSLPTITVAAAQVPGTPPPDWGFDSWDDIRQWVIDSTEQCTPLLSCSGGQGGNSPPIGEWEQVAPNAWSSEPPGGAGPATEGPGGEAVAFDPDFPLPTLEAGATPTP